MMHSGRFFDDLAAGLLEVTFRNVIKKLKKKKKKRKRKKKKKTIL